MTIEEKAKAYNEALENAKYYHNEMGDDVKCVLEECFSELRESEDEQIREQIIYYFMAKKINEPQPVLDSWIAWLEKQGESKSIDMSIKEKAHQIAWKTSKHYDPNACKQEWCEMAALDMASWLEKQRNQKPTDIQSIEKRAHEVFPDDDDENTLLYRQAFIDGAVDYIDCGCKNIAWSEEDERRINHIITFMSDKERIKDTETMFPIEEDIRWLKSIKARHTWKPSDE